MRSARGARIEVKKLGKSYIHNGQALAVLWDVDLSLAPGDMVACVGASGVGKSTFLQILGTLDLPTSGSIKFDGEELTTMSASRLAEFRNHKIGFVFQFHHLLPEFTALENVMMPALIQRIPPTIARQKARDVLGRVGLSHRLTHRPGELSGGEQQRVALARAMVLEPALLLADEPTGNLDRSTGEAIHQLFLDLNRERGSTLLVVTHNPELASLMPRKLRMVDGGRLVEEGNETMYRGRALIDPSEDQAARTSTPEIRTTDVATAANPEGDAKVEAKVEGDSKADSKIDSKIDSRADSKIDSKADSKADSKTEAKAEAKPDAATDEPERGAT
ncbi:MAG: ATP-binding cassette domain-containing protein [Deltaproteobacteria bacterium]|nr:ATP-binding cassette domain-containing protein [Deltaproteobacteria bacterium]